MQEKSNSFVSIYKQINNYMDVPHVEPYKIFVIGIIKIYTKYFWIEQCMLLLLAVLYRVWRISLNYLFCHWNLFFDKPFHNTLISRLSQSPFKLISGDWLLRIQLWLRSDSIWFLLIPYVTEYNFCTGVRIQNKILSFLKSSVSFTCM